MKKQSSKYLRRTILVIVAIAVIFAAGYYLGSLPKGAVQIFPSNTSVSSGLALPGEAEKAVLTVEEVESKILEIGELTTCEGNYNVTRGMDFTRYMLDGIPIPGTTNHVELTCSGIVKAGYDLTKVQVIIDEKSKTIIVSLPEAQVNSNQLIWDGDMVSRDKNNILNPINFDQYQALITEIKDAGLKETEKNGLYTTVEENAQNLIINFLGCFTDYTVEFL